MIELSRFPKGLWYEPNRRRYRVRRYRNNIVYGPYYFRTLDDAMLKLEDLNEELSRIPKERKSSTSPTKGEL